ncbi:MAG: hypothetical protein M1825_005817 [Sarcosagium campestre]|nr:MAG: hypothetical protein M1825_005817 [Sarcosagium campestre]
MPPDDAVITNAIHTPIAKLTPLLPAPSTRSIHGTISLIWPYSSSTHSITLLLVEPDYRLRRSRGQVQVHFAGPSAKAVAETRVINGDAVTLLLDGVEWTKAQEASAVTTPGKSVEWELTFTNRVLLQVDRAERRIASLDINYPAVQPGPHAQSSPIPKDATSESGNSPPVRFSTPQSKPKKGPVNQWTSPAFLKRSRLASGPSPDVNFDFLADDDGDYQDKGRKRPKFSLGGRSWRVSDMSPSPEATQTTEEGEVDNQSAGTPCPEKRQMRKVPEGIHREAEVETTLISELEDQREYAGSSQSNNSNDRHQGARLDFEGSSYGPLSSSLNGALDWRIVPPGVPSMSSDSDAVEILQAPKSPTLNPVPSPNLPVVSPLIPSSRFGSAAETSLTRAPDRIMTPAHDGDILRRVAADALSGHSNFERRLQAASEQGHYENYDGVGSQSLQAPLDIDFDEIVNGEEMFYPSDSERLVEEWPTESHLGVGGEPRPSNDGIPIPIQNDLEPVENTGGCEQNTMSVQDTNSPGSPNELPFGQLERRSELQDSEPSDREVIGDGASETRLEHVRGRRRDGHHLEASALDAGLRQTSSSFRSSASDVASEEQPDSVISQFDDPVNAQLLTPDETQIPYTSMVHPDLDASSEASTSKGNNFVERHESHAEQSEDESQKASKSSPPLKSDMPPLPALSVLQTEVLTPSASFAPLSKLHTLYSSKVDVLAIVSSTTRAERAKKKPRYFFLSLTIADPSSCPASVAVQIFRPFKRALPVVVSGDGVLLRNFKVQSHNRRASLTSGDDSSWAVWKSDREQDVQVKGPPVEYGDEEHFHIKALKEWWNGLGENIRAMMEKDGHHTDSRTKQ